MSQPSKRFVLPYEPEYTAHRTDRRVGRTAQLHRSPRRVAGPALVPDDVDNEPALDGTARRKSNRAVGLERSEGFPPQR
jgi:hypothetical protein